jgi:hypothetical protein
MVGATTMKYLEHDSGPPVTTPREVIVVREAIAVKEVTAVKRAIGAIEVHGMIDPADTREN